jgi:hypothetical protein
VEEMGKIIEDFLKRKEGGPSFETETSDCLSKKIANGSGMHVCFGAVNILSIWV